MLAKFHSAPGHSMETTLTINLPPPQSVRAARGEKLKEKKEEKGMTKKKEKEKEEEEEREREREMEFERENQRELKEQEKDRIARTHSSGNVSYKDKFQKMREKYDKVTLAHEAHERDLELLNGKIKKLQAENDLLLDAMYIAQPGLYQRYFPEERGSPSPPLVAASTREQPYHLPTESQPPPPHSRFSEHPPPPPLPGQSSYYPSTMLPPPPPPPISATSSTSGPPASAGLPSMPPPPSPAASMPPPNSANSNGTVTGDRQRGQASSSRRLSSASTRSRRRSEGHGATGIPLAPEDMAANGGRASGERTPARRTPTPTRSGGMDVDDLPLRSPRVNGASAPPVPMTRERRSLSGTTMNGVRSPTSEIGSRRSSERLHSLSMRAEDIMPERERDRESFHRDPPPMNDDAVYAAYATVNSPDEDDDDEEKMNMDG